MLAAADTAYAIAFVRAQERERPSAERLFDDPYAEIFAAAGAHADDGTKRFLALPFFADGVRLRTRFIDDFVRDGLREGVTQIVLLGAGFDARALRMPEIAAHGANVYEVDLATQLATKRKLLASAGVRVPGSVAYVGCDFAAVDFDATLGASLAARGFRVGAGALFVWEGVLPYIGEDAAARSLRFMVRAGGPGSRVVFDFAPLFDSDPADERARRAGFTLFQQIPFDAIWRRYLPGEPHPNAAVPHMGTAFV